MPKSFFVGFFLALFIYFVFIRTRLLEAILAA